MNGRAGIDLCCEGRGVTFYGELLTDSLDCAKVCLALLELHADVNAKDSGGWTPMMYAADRGLAEVWSIAEWVGYRRQREAERERA